MRNRPGEHRGWSRRQALLDRRLVSTVAKERRALVFGDDGVPVQHYQDGTVDIYGSFGDCGRRTDVHEPELPEVNSWQPMVIGV